MPKDQIPKAISVLCDALNNISLEFLYDSEVPEDDNGNVRIVLERTFCYELYKQWSTLLDKCSLKLSPEIDKKIWDNYKETRKRYPDFVLHNSQHDCEKQILVAEVKRGTATPILIMEDLEKLSYLTSDNFSRKGGPAKFQYGVFIMFASSLDVLLSKLKGLLSTSHKGLWLITRDKDGMEICLITGEKEPKVNRIKTLGYNK